MLGLSYRDVEQFLPVLDCRGSKSSIERDVAEAGNQGSGTVFVFVVLLTTFFPCSYGTRRLLLFVFSIKGQSGVVAVVVAPAESGLTNTPGKCKSHAKEWTLSHS